MDSTSINSLNVTPTMLIKLVKHSLLLQVIDLGITLRVNGVEEAPPKLTKVPGSVHAVVAKRRQYKNRHKVEGSMYGSMYFATSLGLLYCDVRENGKEFTGVQVRQAMDWVFSQWPEIFGKRFGQRCSLWHTFRILEKFNIMTFVRKGKTVTIEVQSRADLVKKAIEYGTRCCVGENMPTPKAIVHIVGATAQSVGKKGK